MPILTTRDVEHHQALSIVGLVEGDRRKPGKFDQSVRGPWVKTISKYHEIRVVQPNFDR